MIYYKEIKVEEHYLNCFEIACKYKIYTTKTDKPHSRFVARIIKEYKARHNITETIYYKTSRGDMMMVYPEAMYEPLIKEMLGEFEVNTPHEMVFDNKTHYFTIKEAIK